MDKEFDVSFSMSDNKKVEYSYNGKIKIKRDSTPGMNVIDGEGRVGKGRHVREAVLNLVKNYVCNLPSQIRNYYC